MESIPADLADLPVLRVRFGAYVRRVRVTLPPSPYCAMRAGMCRLPAMSRCLAIAKHQPQRSGHWAAAFPIIDGRLALGRWPRVFFVDFDGGQRREVYLTILHSG